MSDIYNEIKKLCYGLNVRLSQHIIWVSVASQTLSLFKDGVLKRVFRVSTSRKPPSCVENSNGTPLGLHKIDGKIGDGAPLWTVFRARVPCGLVAEQTPEEQSKNLITTRIMRLRGLQEGVNAGGNVDTFNRYVYIHGTNQEDKIGTPNSHGCVLLSNKEVVELFDVVKDGDIVLISEK